MVARLLAWLTSSPQQLVLKFVRVYIALNPQNSQPLAIFILFLLFGLATMSFCLAVSAALCSRLTCPLITRLPLCVRFP